MNKRFFPRDEEGNADVGKGIYNAKNQLKWSTFKYGQEGNFFLGVAKVESNENGKITGKRCPVFDYTGKKIITIDAYKK